MKYELYQVDAFTSQLFGGNPAAVVPLPQWLPEELMQKLAMENNLSETAFLGPSSVPGADYDIRWFTPEAEIDLCGHATLASAYVLFEQLEFPREQLLLNCKSGLLKVQKDGSLFRMDFPSWPPQPVDARPDKLIEALGNPELKSIWKARDYLLELPDEEAVRAVKPDFTLLKSTGAKVIITAAGRQVDFVSRFFAPAVGVDEDPVTGSAHAQLIPFWAEKLGKESLHALQLSKRGGELWCRLQGDRVLIAGQAVFYMKAEFQV